ncbi:MarR family winged helix-turn-helix transcriptional regulator [Nocardia takedensis]|uniref:MarR family winged helix-turn-helix transcriptional regulator n=1 Tax=Nocardia takedensis TaxID=259390 RepID=UPI0003097D5F|nr:MarR family transcriptional regulator [Nocardia takedensis]
MEDSEALPPHPAADVTEHVGYRLKRAAAALRARMDQALRDHDLTVPQYSCLELLDERPGISGAELARGTFVTRQSSAIVVRGLEQAGLITRPATAEHGRALPVHLTESGRARLRAARKAVYSLETTMVAAIPPARLRALLTDLDRMVSALDPGRE